MLILPSAPVLRGPSCDNTTYVRRLITLRQRAEQLQASEEQAEVAPLEAGGARTMIGKNNNS